jgi:hypothetical protein
MDCYTARSGGLLIGELRLVVHMENRRMWSWSLTIPIGSGYPGVMRGAEADVEVAKRQLYDAWREFLPWAGLAELTLAEPADSTYSSERRKQYG